MTINKQLLFVLAFVLLATFVVKRNYDIFENEEEQYHKELITELNISYAFILKEQRTRSKIIFQQYVKKSDVVAILQSANSDNKKVRDASREKLYNKFIVHYNSAKSRGVRQFMFHLPNNEVFFRFHRPERYGDNLTGIRYSVEKANAELVEVHGFEEGTTFNGFRNIYPLFDNSKHLGSVEISTPFSVIEERMDEMLKNKVAFVLRKEVVNKKVIKKEQSKYKPSELSNDYLFESEFSEDSIMVSINTSLKPKVTSQMLEGEPFVEHGTYNDQNYNIVFIPIKNVEGNHVAYLIAYEKDDALSEFIYEFWKYTLLMLLVVVLFALLIYQLLKKNNELKVSLKEATEKDTRLRLALEGNRDGLWDWNIQTEEVIFDERWAEIVGYTLEELLPISTEAWVKYVHPDDLKKSEELMKIYFAGGTEFYEYESRMKHKNGDWIWILDRGQVVEWDEDGKPLRMTGTHSDITERKEAEEALRINEERLDLAMSVANDGVWDWDLINNSVYFDPRYYTMAGYEVNEFVHTLDEFKKRIHPDYIDYLFVSVDNYLKEKTKDFEVEFLFLHKDGSWMWILGKGKIVAHNSSGIPVRFIGTHSDITEKKKMEKEIIDSMEKAENANKMKSIFLAQMSHEIRTPINALVSMSSLLRYDFEEGADLDQLMSFDIIDRAGGRIIRTVDLLLNLSEIQAGTYETHLTQFDIIHDVVSIVMAEYKKTAKKKNIQLRLDSGLIDTELIADSYTVNQIFAQLIDNAIKYTEEGEVTIKASRNESDQLVVEIKDSGIGIDETYLPKLFEPFSQEEMGYTRKFEGNGIGMALVNKYCELNNAKIEVESKKGVGSTFRVVFYNKNGSRKI